jgi:hypothetical protein
MKAEIRPYKNGFRAYLGNTPISRKPVGLRRASQQKHALLKGGKEEEIRSYSLSNNDMLKIIPTLKVISYPELLDYDNIEDALDEKGRLMILYLTDSMSHGHWTCLLKQKRNGKEYIEYFDPYGGYKPDSEQSWVHKDILQESGQDTEHLTKLLRDSGLKITYNKYPFQRLSGNINTCGRHCLTRLYCKHLSLPQYTQMVKDSGMAGDDFVSSFTYGMMHK